MASDPEKFKKIEEECIKIARKSFFDHIIFKYTHGAIALSIFRYVIKKLGLNEEILKMMESNEYWPFEMVKENEVLLEIENELKNFEKIDAKTLHGEAGLVLKQAKELFKKSKLVEAARGFQ